MYRIAKIRASACILIVTIFVGGLPALRVLHLRQMLIPRSLEICQPPNADSVGAFVIRSACQRYHGEGAPTDA